MPLALLGVVCLLHSLAPSARVLPAGFPRILQSAQEQASPDNSSPQQPAPSDTRPANPLPAEATKSGQTGEPSPTVAPAEPSTDAEPQTARPANSHQNTQVKPPQAAKKKQSPSSTKKTAVHREQRAKPTSASAQPAKPSKVVVKNGSAAEPGTQLAPGISRQRASSQRQGTNDLLANTDENLKKISGRNLASDQQEMVRQIHSYMEQAKAATAAGDLDRAHNLAVKANLLAQALAKP